MNKYYLIVMKNGRELVALLSPEQDPKKIYPEAEYISEGYQYAYNLYEGEGREDPNDGGSDDY